MLEEFLFGGGATVIHPRLKVFIASPRAGRLWEIPPDPKMYVKFSKRRVNEPFGCQLTSGAPANVLPKADKGRRFRAPPQAS